MQAVNANMLALLSGSAPLLRLQSDSSLQQTLQLGQVIEARVMRSFQGGRYLLELAGQERVVDSSIPLQEGQVLRARVLSMDEQVVLERLQAKPQQALAQQTADAGAPAWLQRTGAEAALQLYAQYAWLLGAQQWQALEGLARVHGSHSVTLAALALARLGVPLQTGLLQTLAQALSGHSLLRPGQTILAATTAQPAGPGLAQAGGVLAGAGMANTAEDAQVLSQLLSEELAQAGASLQTAAGQAHTGDDAMPGDDSLARAMAAILLNARQDGSLAQRVLSLPLSVNGRLTELRLALFDESDQQSVQPELRQRTLRIALELDALGRVELLARLVNRHVSLEWTSASESLALLAGGQDSALAQSLNASGFTLDSARYVAGVREEGAAMQEVMARVIAGGGFSVLA